MQSVREEYTQVIGVARAAPPSRCEKLGAAFGGQVREAWNDGSRWMRCAGTIEGHTFGIASVAEVVLLAVGAAEDVVSGEVHEEDGGGGGETKLDGVEDEVACLEGVRKGDPREVADGKHESEAVGGDVHGG